MRGRVFPLAAVTLALLAPAAGSSAARAHAAPLPWWKNCTELHKKYPHGLGKANAHDFTSGEPVTNFFRSNKLYAIAISHNKSLDRDHDGIACEKR